MNLRRTSSFYLVLCLLMSLAAVNSSCAQTCSGTCVPDYANEPDGDGSAGYYVWDTTLCVWVWHRLGDTPIIIDTDGSGFHLTSAANGVEFDFYGTGKPIQIAWTAEGSTNGWLALDRNHKGRIDSGRELFGNITDQPPSEKPNGFLALAVFDTRRMGGNGDGKIDSKDAVWPDLFIWIDANHDGISQPEELRTLDDIGIHSISLAYRETLITDLFGNQFRYKGHLNPGARENVNRDIYDVVLATE